MASFGGGVGDIIVVSKICFSLYQACSKGRKGAPAAVLALANELWACSTALDQLAAAVSRSACMINNQELKDITVRMLSGCRNSLDGLQKLIDKYEDINKDFASMEGHKWIRKFKVNVKKSQWMYEENEVQRTRNKIEANVRALNLLLNIMTGNSVANIETQLAKLQDSLIASNEHGDFTAESVNSRMHNFQIGQSSYGYHAKTELLFNDLRRNWHSVLTDFAKTSRFQMSIMSMDNDNIDQLIKLWETRGINQNETNTIPTGIHAKASASDVDYLEGTNYQRQILVCFSELVSELNLLIFHGEEKKLQIPSFVAAMIFESAKLYQHFGSQQTNLTCLDAGQLFGQWLRQTRERDGRGDAPHSSIAQDDGILIKAYFSIIKQLVRFWSWILRGIKMNNSPIYPHTMLDYEPQLLNFKRQILETSDEYWTNVRAGDLSSIALITDLNDKLDLHSQSYIQNVSESARELNRLQIWLKPIHDVEEERTLQRVRQWPNTCQWLFSKTAYCDWMLGVLPGILWCHARPGYGKSVLSGFLAQQFQDAGETCCFFPFRYNNEALRYPQSLLRTIAFQMAEQNPQIRARLLELSVQDLNVESARLGLLWQKLFCNGIFQSRAAESFYWVIDALDEAEPTELHHFISLLSDLQSSETPIKVILFSRYSREIAMRLSTLPITVSEVLPDDNIEDIRRYTKERLATSAIALQNTYQSKIMDIIVTRSSGTFLWVTKAIDALEQEELIADVLACIDESSQGLSQVYDSITNQMENMTASQILMAKTILSWTTCAARPLSISELGVVLNINFGVLIDVASTVKNLCGQLLAVDKQGRVQANHMTVQEYLKSNAPSTFRVDSESMNDQIASFCLETLGARQGANDSDDEGEQSICSFDTQAFREYACLFWHVHLGRISCNTGRIQRINEFLDSPGGVNWLESLAACQRLDQTLATVKTLKVWAGADEYSPGIVMLDRLQRLAAKLGYTDDLYEGKFLDGLRHGSGSSIYANGDKYVGRWRGDVREGKGTCTFASGSVYEGLWSNDVFHGHGRLTSPDGCVYEGEWVSGRRHGYGVMHWTWTERFKYEGQWSKDRFHGWGTMIYYTGSSYVGEWSDGREHGHGKISYWNGDSYEGEFEDGCEVGNIERQGEAPVVLYDNDSRNTATVRYSSGARYEGQVNEKGLPDGKGALHGTTGVSWIGDFVDGRAHGAGYALRPRGGRFIGPMQNFVANGYFIDINDMPNGGKYTGQISDTAREGSGVLETAFQYVYEGEFHRNEMHGDGVRRYHNGDVYQGMSQDGYMEGFGEMRYNDGWTYRGQWQKDKKDGKGGSLKLSNWGMFEGTWINDQIRSDSKLIITDGVLTLKGLP